MIKTLKLDNKKDILNTLKTSISFNIKELKYLYIEKKEEYLLNNKASLFIIDKDNNICVTLETYLLSEFPVPVVEKDVLYINSIEVKKEFRNDLEIISITNKLLVKLKKDFKHIILLSSPFNDELNTFYKHIGFAPLLSYETYLTESSFWLFDSFNSSFIKRIPLNIDNIKQENVDIRNINFRLISNYQHIFHIEVRHFITELKKKFQDKIKLDEIYLKNKSDSIKYGTDFCILMNNKIINPVNLLKFDFEEYIRLLEI